MGTRWQALAPLVVMGVAAVLMLPQSLDSWLVSSAVLVLLTIASLWGWFRGSWLAVLLIATFILMADLFGLVRSQPNGLWVVMLGLWLGGAWVMGHVGDQAPSFFHQVLASFLVLEVFLALQLWPINVLSKAVIAVAFAFLLWHELSRTAPDWQRLRESVVPFLLIVVLMTLTGQWLTF